MYIEMNPTGLTLTDLICVAHRKRNEDTGFPYSVQSCRCSNCRYVSEGKCSLKECCCMAERVRAHTCTFAEILNTCFAVVVGVLLMGIVYAFIKGNIQTRLDTEIGNLWDYTA